MKGIQQREFIKNKVSLVTPVYNGETYLSPMLESILKQTYQHMEVILVDDGSTDSTIEVAESYQKKFQEKGYEYRIVKAKHKCAAAAINQGLPFVTGEYLIWPDSDDRLEPESVEKRVRFLELHPEYECVRSLSYYFDQITGEVTRADEKTGDVEKEDLFWDILESKTFVCCGCYMLKTKSFFEIYPNNHIPEYEFNVGQNFQMLLPFMYRHKCPTIPERLYGVCVREGSHSRKKLTQEEEERKYSDYEKLIDDIANICRITDKSSRNHMEYWKAKRAYWLAVKYGCKRKMVKALWRLNQCGEISTYKALKDAFWVYFGNNAFVKRLYAIYQGYKQKYQETRMKHRQERKRKAEAEEQASAPFLGENNIEKICSCKENKVALTFDATWGNQNTGHILDKLKKHNIKATFFISGIWIERYPEDYQKIVEAGHEIGNHSYSHPYMSKLSDEEVFEEIEKTQSLLTKDNNISINLFRFPYGERNERLLQDIKNVGLLSVLWSIDSEDWKGISAEEILKNIKDNPNLEKGAIILLHNAGEHTVEALELIIPVLKAMGYGFGRISDLLKEVPEYNCGLKQFEKSRKI